MATYLKLFSWTVFSILVAYILNFGIDFKGQEIPGFGKLLNPTSGLWKNAENDARFKNITINFKGLDGEIRIIYDQRLVPHIFAKTTKDALFAQGFVEASNRLWQMDFLSREAGGKLSEVIGVSTKKYDIRRRKEGLLYGAELAVQQWEKQDQTLNLMQSYLNGINHYISNLKKQNWPIEFKILDYSPTEWTILHSALILKSMTSTLASYNEDIQATNMMLEIGIDSFKSLYPVRDPNQSPIIPESNESALEKIASRNIPTDNLYKGPALNKLSAYNGITGAGSNNWAVNTRKTRNGHPILSNDPHLNLTLPSIWYEIHIVTPDFNAYGVTIPGMPGIMIGMNEYIAWGNTNVGHDVLDYYTIDWSNEEKSKYHVDGQEKSIELRREVIKIKNAEDFIFNIKETDFGLIYYESEDDLHPPIARDWIGYRKHDKNETSVFVNIMKSRNYSEFKKASNDFFAPAQNFLFASKEDTVALRVNGNLPLKYDQEGRFVKKGNSLKNRWTSYIPRNHNPESVNPARGFVSSANQVSTGTDYPYFYNGGFEEYRGKRVNDILNEKEELTIEDMKQMQLDVFSIKAAEFLPMFLESFKEYDPQSEVEKKILNNLINWDYNYTKDNTASKYFDSWFSEFRNLFWKNYFDINSMRNMLYPEDWMLMQKGLEDLDFNHHIIKLSFENLCKKWKRSESYDLPLKIYRSKSIDHLLQIPAFSHRHLEVGGCGDVLNAISSSIGPSWRMIVELDDETRAQAVFPGGQSGSPSSRFYDDSMDEWIEGKYHSISLVKNPEELKNQMLYRISIKPGK